MSPEDKDEMRAKAIARDKLGGGLKGGKARAEKLTVKRRKLIASEAAKSRWNKWSITSVLNL
jgi:hypothetical protein